VYNVHKGHRFTSAKQRHRAERKRRHKSGQHLATLTRALAAPAAVPKVKPKKKATGRRKALLVKELYP